MPWREPVHHLELQVKKLQHILIVVGLVIVLVLMGTLFWVNTEVMHNRHNINTIKGNQVQVCQQLHAEHPSFHCHR